MEEINLLRVSSILDVCWKVNVGDDFQVWMINHPQDITTNITNLDGIIRSYYSFQPCLVHRPWQSCHGESYPCWKKNVSNYSQIIVWHKKMDYDGQM